jgi:two-component system phosphate regulon sensor histidine kinase PhoR
MIVVSMFAADVYLASSVDALLTKRIADDLRARLALASRVAEGVSSPLDDRTAWGELAAAIGRDSHSRLSIIRADGTLLGDSQLDATALAKAENHRERPEFIKALSGEVGASTRFSETIGERMTYVATPLRRAGQTVGVVRLALPLTEVDAAVDSVHHLLLMASLIALGVSIVMSGVISRWASRRAWQLAKAARRMADGDLSTRMHATGSDEFAALGRALDRLAASLSSTLTELRSERDLLGGILDGMQEGVLLLDENGHVALVNAALREMLLLGADTSGRALVDIFRDPELGALVERTRGLRTPVLGEIEVAGLKPRRLLVRALALSREPAGILAVFVDVTELRRLEKLRKDFVANVSHELRTPVTAIRSATETLQDAAKSDPGAVPMFVDIIARNADRMHQLVEDLLDLSRIESREYKLNLESVDLAQAVPQAFALFRERATKKGLQLISKVPADLFPVRADARALEQVLTNLLENAIKYCPEGAQIRVSAAAEGERLLRLEVEDTGPGIEAKHLPRLFERFYRIDKGRARDVGGTGLGLSIVKHLVEAMGGEVGVESEPGRGSTFHVTLLRARSSETETTRTLTEPLPADPATP